MRQLRSPGLRASVVLLLSYLLSSASAIYEDQAGTFDWYKQYVGQPSTVQFIPGRERVYVATNQNLLASMQTKAGSIAWRRRYTDQDPLDKIIALQRPALVLAASKGGKYVRAWDALEGGFRWESLVFEGQSAAGAQSSCDIAAVDLGGSRGQAVAVAASDKLQVFAAAKGDLLWSADLELAGQASQKLILTTDSSIAVVAYTPGTSEVHLLSFSAADGSHQQSHALTTDTALGSNAAVSGSAVAMISSDKQQLCTLLLAAHGDNADSRVVCQHISNAAPDLADSNGGLHLKLLPAGADFSLTAGKGVALVRVTPDGAEQTHWFAQATAAAPTTAATTPLTALASYTDHSSSVTVELLDTKSGKVLASSSLAVPEATYLRLGPAPSIAALWLDAQKCSKAASSSSSSAMKRCQLVLLWSDDQLSFVANNTIIWNQEEALASAQSSIVVDLPAARTAAAAAAQSGSSRGGLLGLLQDQERLKLWVRLQVLSVLVQFKMNHDHEKEEFYELRQALSDNNLPYRDTNGFRKLIVLLTATGKVFGLHSGDGRIIWAHNSPATAHSGEGPQQQQQQYLRLWKRFHDLTHAPQLAVITAGSGTSSVQVVNGHTGEQLQHMQLPYSIDKVIPIHNPVHDGAADQFITLLVEPLELADANTDDLPPTPKVNLLPHTPAAQTFVSQASSSIFFWLKQTQPSSSPAAESNSVDGDVTTIIRGYRLESAVGPDDQAGGVSFPVVPAWQVVLPGQVLGMAAKDPAEPVHSYVKVLGDRSLKYNYLNPNLVFIATGTPLGSDSPPDEASVSVAVVNTVTGAVLYQQVHSGCAGPVYAVVSENWVVYTMRDVVSLRQQASVIELYDASHHDLSIESIILGRTQHSTTHSSYGSVTLEVLTQSFYLQHFIKGLSVTQTKQGITTKQLLVQTTTDQVYALDKRFLDPRRPLRAKATPEEMEERLVPYNELVLFNTLQYVTQDKQVFNLRGVTVAGAVLESTTLVLCYGADLFYTRISPALNFDSLQSDFSYGLLVVALIALVVGTWFASYSSQQAMLKAKWQ